MFKVSGYGAERTCEKK